MKHYLGRAWAEIDLDAIDSNYNVIKEIIPEGTKIMTVVKGNANNCGDVAVARSLEKYADSWYGVANLDEAIGLREAGITHPILILGYTPVCHANVLGRYRITQTIVSYAYALQLAKAAEENNVQVDVHIKLDTGMNRIGLVCYDDCFEQAMVHCREIAGMKALSVSGVFTHIATFYNEGEKEPEDFARTQYERFQAFTDEAARRGIDLGLRHCCNSPGTVNHPEMAMDMVRVGTAILGGLADNFMREAHPFRKVMEIKTVVSCVKKTKKGARFGYGQQDGVDRDMTVATLPIGYADICRLGEQPVTVLIQGKRCTQLGDVCMDQMMVDVTGLSDVAMGEEVVLLGVQGDDEIDLAEFGAFVNTSSDEAYCHLTKRLPHIYLRDGKPAQSDRYTVDLTDC